MVPVQCVISFTVTGDLLTTVSPDEGLGWTNYGLHGRIVNGTKAALRQFPHQVSSKRDGMFRVDRFHTNYYRSSMLLGILEAQL